VLNRTPTIAHHVRLYSQAFAHTQPVSMHFGRLLDRREALAAFYALAGLRVMKCITSNMTPAIRAI
jgi:hypothetical protein